MNGCRAEVSAQPARAGMVDASSLYRMRDGASRSGGAGSIPATVHKGT